MFAQDGATAGAARKWETAVEKWVKEGHWRAPETIRREAVLLGYAEWRLRGRELVSIRRADLEAVRNLQLQRGNSARSANYAVGVVTAILRAAVRWEWITSAPKLEKIPEGPQPERALTPDQAGKLMRRLPLHLRRMATFSLETGIRQGNARKLEWRHVQWSRNRLYFPASEMKNRIPLCVPLTPVAAAMLRECEGDHIRYVFTYQGGPIAQPTNTAWYRAIRALGLDGVRWHDLRHSWASWHMEAGTDALVLQKLGGWKTLAMVGRYTHLNDDAAQAAVRQFAERRSRAP